MWGQIHQPKLNLIRCVQIIAIAIPHIRSTNIEHVDALHAQIRQAHILTSIFIPIDEVHPLSTNKDSPARQNASEAMIKRHHPAATLNPPIHTPTHPHSS